MNPDVSTYHALRSAAVLFDRSDRMRIEVAGPDRAKFLHNITTNDVKRLAPEHGREAFVTSLQGKTLGYVTLLACDDRILLRSDPAAYESLVPHLSKYSVFDEVTWQDVAGSTFELHLAGPRAETLLHRLGTILPASGDLDHAVGQLGGIDVRVIREAPTGRPGLTLIGPAGFRSAVVDRLRSEGAEFGLVDGDAATFEAARIEAGAPRFGQDVTVDNLPQEVGRDTRAISFVKGCYLGQETVARIDALGHVNKHLRGLKLAPQSPAGAGADLEFGGKRVGTITSAAVSPGWGCPIALAYLRTSAAEPGTEVQVRQGATVSNATVAGLPMIPE